MSGFNFKDVMHELGISTSDSKRNQVVGRMLSKWAAENGISPSRDLTAKTNREAKVGAPHCICHYPQFKFKSATEYVELNTAEVDERQLKLL